jgi:hypothetical protein
VDPAADIADFYAWHDDNGHVVTIVTFAGLTAAGGSATWDADVLYGVHIDNNGDNLADHNIWVRFGQDAGGGWGMQVVGLPGGDATVEGNVDMALDAGNGLKAWAGLADDPFFFDLQGFNDTLATGTLSFDPTRDSLAGTNVTAIALTMDEAAARGASTTFDIWTTTARLQGN